MRPTAPGTTRPRTTRPRSRGASALLVLVVLTLAATGCSARAADPVPAGLDDRYVRAEGDQGPDRPFVRTPRTMLRRSTSCDDLLRFYVDGATDLVGPYGLGGGGYGMPGIAVEESAAADTTGGAPPAPAGGDAAAATSADQVSGTNVQEEGVDEPDLVKSDGRIIVTAVTGRVQVVDVATARVISEIPLPDDHHGAELLLDGTDLLILSTGGFGGPVPLPEPGPAATVPAFPVLRTTATRVDLADPANPQVLGGIRMEGGYRSARMVDGTVRLVVVSDPTGLAFVHPADGSLQAEDEAEAANRRILAESDVDDWVPHLEVIGPDGAATAPQRVHDCTDIAQPPTLAGLQTLSVLTLDLRGDGLTPSSTAGLVAAGDTVYASTDRLVISTSPWGGWVVPFLDIIGPPQPEDLVTHLHTFDIADPATTRYVASGEVRGTLIGQFALDEHDGVIRVATTTDPGWAPEGAQQSQSSLITLAEEGERLVELGRVDGLGVTERIQAVRYLTPSLAAIVTFRQVDPLYLVDTGDPAAPRVTGELKIPGYSAYLHPVADGYLLGIGQDADPETGRALGVQASLFDIRDLAAPQRVAQVTFGQGSSPVEWDHRAFLHWAPTGQAVIPIELYGFAETPQGDIVERPEDVFAGAAVLQVGAGSLAEQGRIAHTDPQPGTWSPGIIRSIVVGDDLWTLTYESLARHDLAGLQREVVVDL